MSEREKIVVIVEKDPLEAEIVAMQLRKAEIKCEDVRISSREVFQTTVEQMPPDLVIVNYGVPRFDVLAALTEAKQTMPGVPWIVISNVSNEEIAVSCMKAGASDYITKKNIAQLGPSAKSLLEKMAGQEKPEKEDSDEPAGEEELPDHLFRRVAESSPDLIAIVGPDGRRVYNNPAYTGILADPDTLLGTDSFVDIHPDDQARIRRVFAETLATGVGQVTEYRLLDKKGNPRWIESNSSVIAGGEGFPEYVVIFSRDVSDRVDARTVGSEEPPDNALRNAVARLRSAFERLNVPLLMADMTGTVSFVNAECTRVTGYSSAELAGKCAWPLLFPAEWKEWLVEYPETLQRKDGSSVQVMILAVPSRNADGRIVGTLASIKELP